VGAENEKRRIWGMQILKLECLKRLLWVQNSLQKRVDAAAPIAHS